MILVTPDLTLDDAELVVATSRSAGPGGQNVNKVETRVTLRFDVAGSPSLSESQRERIRVGLPTRISKAGILSVSSQKERSQSANREAARERLVELLQGALAEVAPRKPTRKPRAANRRRLDSKRRRSAVKAGRTKPRSDE